MKLLTRLSSFCNLTDCLARGELAEVPVPQLREIRTRQMDDEEPVARPFTFPEHTDRSKEQDLPLACERVLIVRLAYLTVLGNCDEEYRCRWTD
jgi:hypothetical protein